MYQTREGFHVKGKREGLIRENLVTSSSLKWWKDGKQHGNQLIKQKLGDDMPVECLRLVYEEDEQQKDKTWTGSDLSVSGLTD